MRHSEHCVGLGNCTSRQGRGESSTALKWRVIFILSLRDRRVRSLETLLRFYNSLGRSPAAVRQAGVVVAQVFQPGDLRVAPTCGPRNVEVTVWGLSR